MKLHDNVSPFSFSDFMLLKIADALGPVYMEASQPGKRAGPLSETNVWLVFIWESQPGKRAECFGSNAHARKERAKIAFVNMAPRVKSSLIPAALHVLTAVSLVFQLYGIIIMWKVNELRRNQAVFTDILRKRNYFIQKMKHRKQRALNRSKRSCWYKKGRTDLWWKNLINGVADEESIKFSIIFSSHRNCFLFLVFGALDSQSGLLSTAAMLKCEPRSF